MAVNPTVLSEIREGVCRITLNRPDRRNAVDSQTARALHAAFVAAAGDDAARVVVLSGTGTSFCSGWDVEAVGRLRDLDADAVREEFEANTRLLEDIRAAPLPTIAAVRGAVLGFGIGLVCACDLVVAEASASIGLPEVPIGIVPGLVMLDLLETLPPKIALDWLLTGERRPAEDAYQRGLFTRLVRDGELDTSVDELADRLASFDPGTLLETKRSFARLRALPRDAAIDAAVDAAVAALVRR